MCAHTPVVETAEPSGHGSIADNPAVSSSTSGEVSPLWVLGLLLRRRRTIAGATILFALASLLLALLKPGTFTVQSAFIPQVAEGRASGLANLAGQFGFQLPTENPGETPEFYADLIKSREILGALATDPIQPGPEEPGVRARSKVIADLLELPTVDESMAARREAGFRWLHDEAVAVSVGRETGIVTTSIRTPWPYLSQALSERLLSLVNDFNLQTRQSRAAAERRFIEGRMAEVRDSLANSERSLEEFLGRNRQFLANRQTSPELMFDHDRLQRVVAAQQEVYNGLAQAYEQARISEVRNTPVITVLVKPEPPLEPDPRSLWLKLVLGMLLGGMIGLLGAIWQDYWEKVRIEDSADFRLLSDSWAEIRSSFPVIRSRMSRIS